MDKAHNIIECPSGTDLQNGLESEDGGVKKTYGRHLNVQVSIPSLRVRKCEIQNKIPVYFI